MKSLLIKIGCTDIAEIEKQINEKIKDLTGVVSIKMTSNGQHSMAVVLYDGGDSGITPAKVKIVDFSINDTIEAQKKIDEALKDLTVVSVEPTCVIDMNRLIIVYKEKTTEEGGGNVSDPDSP